MDWDGVGTFALFISSGAIGIGVIALKAYKAKLDSKLEWAKLRRVEESMTHDTAEHLERLEQQIQRLSERLDFNENLLSDGSDSTQK